MEDLLNGLTPEQRSAVENRAAAMGMTVEEFLGRATQGGGDGAAASPISYNPEGEPRERGFSPEEAGNFLDTALAEVPIAPSAAGAPNPTANKLLDLIGRHEARGNYNAVYGNARATRDLGALSVNQILAEQVAARYAGAPSTAIGKYQFIYKTLRGLKRELGLTGEEKFTPALQDRMAYALLQRRGLDNFLAGKMSKRAFALQLSQEWASLPDPYTGRSYYAGDGLNASSTSPARVYEALGLLQPGATPEPALAAYQPSAGSSGIDPYGEIPEKDSLGLTNQRERFRQWNPDPIGNNEANIGSLEPDLGRVIKRAQEIAGVQFVVGSGKRDAALQRKAVEWGWSKTEDSDHLHGDAADLWPIIDGKVKFDRKAQLEIVRAMKQASEELGVGLDVGAEWKRARDLPHFGLRGRSA